MNEYEDMSFEAVQPEERNRQQVVGYVRGETGVCYVVEGHVSLH